MCSDYWGHILIFAEGIQLCSIPYISRTEAGKHREEKNESPPIHSQLLSFCVIFQPVNAQIFMIQFFTVIFWHFIWHAIWQCCCWLGNGICSWVGAVYTTRKMINCTSLALFIHWMAYKHMSFEKTICNML